MGPPCGQDMRPVFNRLLTDTTAEALLSAAI